MTQGVTGGCASSCTHFQLLRRVEIADPPVGQHQILVFAWQYRPVLSHSLLQRCTSMKKVLIVSILIVMSAIAGSAVAEKPEKGGKPEKSVILHCGCNEAADGLVYKQISVSPKARGHANHVQGTYESCVDDLGNATELMRISGDCLVSGPQLRVELPLCEDLSRTGGPQAGETCGVLARE